MTEATRLLPLVSGHIEDALRSREELLAENLLLHQQLVVAFRKVKAARFRPLERGLFVLLASGTLWMREGACTGEILWFKPNADTPSLARALQETARVAMPILRCCAFYSSAQRRLCRLGTAWRPIAPLGCAGALLALPAAASAASESTRPNQREADAIPVSRETSVYASGAAGLSTLGPAFRGLLTIARGPHFVGLAAGNTGEFFPEESPGLELTEVGPMVGFHASSSYLAGSAGVGLAAVHSTTRGKYLGESDGFLADREYEKVKGWTLGIPLMVHGVVHLGPVGLGAMLFGNFNSALSMIGAAGTLNLGMI